MVRILHLFPELMNLYGEHANITVLKRHLEDQGIKVEIDKKELGNKIKFSQYDLIYMGSGTEANQIIALDELKNYEEEFIDCILNNKVILFTGNAMELLGKYIDNSKGLGIFDFETKHTDNIYSGNVILKNNELGFVVGNINRSSLIKGTEDNKLFDYIYMDNSLQDNTFEGYHKNNLYATHVIGPILVKNPDFMKKIVQLLMPKGKKIKYIKYEHEVNSYILALETLKDKIDDR